jgi:hypothetical protein
VAAVWLGYVIARTAYRSEHKVPLPHAGEIVPLFEEEVYAPDLAANTYQQLRAKDKKLRDVYWDDVLKVKSNGFMREYARVYLKRSDWPASQKPKNLHRFESWRRANLKDHRPQTVGQLGVEKT